MAAASSPTPERRRFLIGSATGIAIAVAAFTWLITIGRADLLVREPFGNFYDAQARALLSGHWWVPASELQLEGFRIGSRTFTYFGLWPSVLRMPAMQLAPSLYGRLTQVSMVLAFVVYLTGVSALHWRIRTLLRPTAAYGRLDRVLAVAIPIVFGCGTSAIFLASRAWVYHEAIIWGVAWSVVAFERILAFTSAPTIGRLAAAGGTAALAISSRASVGLGPVIALGLVFGGQLIRAIRAAVAGRMGRDSRVANVLGRLEWLGVRDSGKGPRRWAIGTGVAAALALASHVVANFARFGTLLSVPWARQALFLDDPTVGRALRANGGSYFGLQFAPTTLLQYLRPDALGSNALFPWVTFPHFRTPVIGSAVVDALDFSTSVTASMTAISILAVVGVVVACSTRAARGSDAWLVRVPLIGAAGGVVLVLTIAFVANRYLGDWLPFLALAALAGLHALVDRTERVTPGARPRVARPVLIVTAVLAVAGLWINASLAIVYQRLYNPYPLSLRAGMLETQYRIDGKLGGGARQSETVAALPKQPARAGTTAVVGDCAALYWSDGRSWHLVEGSGPGGIVRLRAQLPDPTDTQWRPLLSWGPDGGQAVIGIRRVGDRAQITLGLPGPDGSVSFNAFPPPFAPNDAAEHTISITVSDPLEFASATVDGSDVMFIGGLTDLPVGPFTVGSARMPGVADNYGAALRELAPKTDLCQRIRADQTEASGALGGVNS